MDTKPNLTSKAKRSYYTISREEFDFIKSAIERRGIYKTKAITGRSFTTLRKISKSKTFDEYKSLVRGVPSSKWVELVTGKPVTQFELEEPNWQGTPMTISQIPISEPTPSDASPTEFELLLKIENHLAVISKDLKKALLPTRIDVASSDKSNSQTQFINWPESTDSETTDF